MAYRSTEKTRQKKDAKRTAMMQAAVQVFAEKGYHSATVRDVVKAADVAIGTFYFYFPDKETLFTYLYEETADFLVQTLQQSVNAQRNLPNKIMAGVQSYINIALYEPAVVNLLLVGGIGAVPSLNAKRVQFRQRLTQVWKRPLDEAIDAGELVVQDTQFSAEFIAGGVDEIVLNLLTQTNPDSTHAVQTLSNMILGLVRFRPKLEENNHN